MSSALQVNFSIVNTLWSLFGDLAWSSVPSDRSTDGDLVDLFLQHGPPFDVGAFL
ncbi:hypothetical protein OF83DRAFT_1176919 [Amylostereum chailletii]|nr:hypothetical protein OF83DRAFT_1176919 [Amylostereum chailletii]